MKLAARLSIALVAAVIVGGAFMAYDKSRGAEWEVSPQQIAEAKSRGQIGYETRPGTVAVVAIRKETADALPLKWAVVGVAAGAFVLSATRRRKPKIA
ncbi:hypothetical protein SAMN05216548_11512 [Faunimonas pinastri]|uniref:Uncharacterized protein n=1 Tax=Faunimonas pinastri TaxID=1855383 RepID=A0A1H9N6F4_9HYPH|nr:hypothetical protein [Faunimonas pinastri]SER31492.1 hypothetical protein SAMN05216548_11512 [Faunimonas pinastri]